MNCYIGHVLGFINDNGLDYLIIPSNDEFMGINNNDSVNRIKKICGFSGSNGLLIFGRLDTHLITDGRYLLQASKETKCKIIDIAKCSLVTFCKNLDMGIKVGLLSELHSYNMINHLVQSCENVSFVMLNVSNLDSIIGIERSEKSNDYFELGIKYTGLDKSKKIANVLSNLDNIVDAIVISDPASLCWLLNIRGSDDKYTPIYNAYGLLFKNQDYFLFRDPKQLCNVISDSFTCKVIQIDGSTMSYSVASEICKTGFSIVNKENPILKHKCVKNSVEVSGFRAAHIIDGVSMCKFLHWLENAIDDCRLISECDVAEMVDEFRFANGECISQSFGTIVGFRENASIIHYHPHRGSDIMIDGNGILLVDSGGQYLNGTTDITRTIAVNDVSEEMRHDFTLVLKGHIAIAMAIFPKGTSGADIDCLARQFLWRECKNYAHGTGHGVGHYSFVHEGPIGISKVSHSFSLDIGMILSNEPGYYKNNEYGIRIENLLTVVAYMDGFLRFSTITMVPIDIKMIDVKLLTNDEIKWINEYHALVYENVVEHLRHSEKSWLKNATMQIPLHMAPLI